MQYCLEIDYGLNNDSLTHMQHYLPMDMQSSLLLHHNVVCNWSTLFAEPTCTFRHTLSKPSWCVMQLMSFLLSWNLFTTVSTSQQHNYTLMVYSRHYFTFSTLAPIYRMVNTCIDLVYNAAPMQLLKYIPVCTVPSFFNFGFVTITIGIIRFIARDRLVRKLTYRAQ